MARVRRLLVIDDEIEVREIIREIAEEAGYIVEEARTESEFKASFQSFDPGVIVIDMVLPDIDGLSLVRYLAERFTQARVVIMSGYGQDYVAHAQRLGNAYGLADIQGLSKPFSLASFRAVIN